jgi:acyl-CoA hydrolase
MIDQSLLESSTRRLVKPEDLNHHGTLFAGQIARWLIESGVITAARLIGNPEDIVCVKVNSLTFKKPINNGDIIEIKSRIAHVGATSITVYSEVWQERGTAPVVSNYAIFVTVDKQNKPYEHGFKLTKEYISRNRSIYDQVLKNREER